MEKELNYLSHNIEILERKLDTLESNKKNFDTTTEVNFYVSKKKDLEHEKEILENILAALTINMLT